MINNQLPVLRPEAAPPVNPCVDEAPIVPVLTPWLAPFRQSAFSIGLSLLALSVTLFALHDWLSKSIQGDSAVFFVMLHYAIAVAYSVFLLTNGCWKFRRAIYAGGRSARWLGLLLWLVSAYALNRSIVVFQQSTGWLWVVLCVIGTAMVAFAFRDALSVRMQQVIYAVLAIGLWLFTYMALYVAPLYPFSVPLLLGLGLSIHTFVPLAFTIALGKRLWQDYRHHEHLRLGIWVGLLVPVGVLTWFLTGWNGSLNRIEKVRQEAILRKTTDLPDWVLMAQQLQPDWITSRLLLADHTFDTGHLFNSNWGINSLTALDDVRQHDPLVVIAALLFPADVLTGADKLSLLSVMAAKRHGAEEKFWTGQHLTVESITTQVRVWPQFRLAYTEQTVRIRNNARNTTEEALLTLHLPAGSVVSGMSLWVNGREEPARLTTVAKADSAYRQVVNVESRPAPRDPSVVYWQEGNCITVRVFPCRAGQDRQVKLGSTTPLSFVSEQLTYQPVIVEGLPVSSARALVQVDFDQVPDNLQVPRSFKRVGNQLTYRGGYDTDWKLTMAAPALSAEPFVLNENAYQLAPYQPVLESVRFTDVYLDGNAAWTPTEFKMAYQSAKRAGARVWVFDDGLHQLTEAELDETFGRLSANSFSLFPVYRINPATALLVTKGVAVSPILNDLKGSRFADHFGLLTRQTGPIRTVCLTDDLSPYLKTLAELRVLNVQYGDAKALRQILEKRRFGKAADTDSQVVLTNAGLVIQETATGSGNPSNTPDHLARLFAYNHLLQQIGRHYFEPHYQTNALIAEAQRAHVVSPLSSLIVLETAADYNRFGIHRDASGLSNASLKEEGAVPEPHEWALLVMVVGLLSWLAWQKQRCTTVCR